MANKQLLDKISRRVSAKPKQDKPSTTEKKATNLVGAQSSSARTAGTSGFSQQKKDPSSVANAVKYAWSPQKYFKLKLERFNLRKIKYKITVLNGRNQARLTRSSVSDILPEIEAAGGNSVPVHSQRLVNDPDGCLLEIFDGSRRTFSVQTATNDHPEKEYFLSTLTYEAFDLEGNKTSITEEEKLRLSISANKHKTESPIDIILQINKLLNLEKENPLSHPKKIAEVYGWKDTTQVSKAKAVFNSIPKSLHLKIKDSVSYNKIQEIAAKFKELDISTIDKIVEQVEKDGVLSNSCDENYFNNLIDRFTSETADPEPTTGNTETIASDLALEPIKSPKGYGAKHKVDKKGQHILTLSADIPDKVIQSIYSIIEENLA